jgi:small-conductance mechanosensitive channel
VTATATPTSPDTQAAVAETVPADSAGETVPTIVPGEVKEVSTAVAARTPLPSPTPGRVDQEIAEITAELGLSGKSFLGITVEDWINVGVSILIVLVGYFLVARLLTVILRWVVRHTSTELDDALIRHMEPDLKWLVLLFFARFAFLRLDFLSDTFRKTLVDLFFGLGLLIFTVVGIRLIRFGAAWYLDNLDSEEERVRLDPIVMTVRRISILVLLIFALTIGLSHLGINLGMLSIAILVLAVIASVSAKDTISDAISGFVILLDQPFRINDRIQIKEFDTWGDVMKIGTRATHILTRDNREVIIPNAKIVNSRLVNFTYPDPEYRLQVDLRLAFDSDLEKARQVIVAGVRQVDGVLPDKPVDVLYIGFGDTARRLRVRWWIADYHLQYPLLDRVCTAIDSALDQAGIELPMITYDLNVRLESSQESPEAPLMVGEVSSQ